MRNLMLELSKAGFTEEQARDILNWTETLPIKISGNNISAEIKQGEVLISSANTEPIEHTYPDCFIKELWFLGLINNPIKCKIDTKKLPRFSGEISFKLQSVEKQYQFFKDWFETGERTNIQYVLDNQNIGKIEGVWVSCLDSSFLDRASEIKSLKVTLQYDFFYFKPNSL